jgi:hypothetical protein
MLEKVSKTPIILVLAAAAASVLALSIAQFNGKKSEQETALKALQKEHEDTSAAMRELGRRAAAAEEAAAAAREKAYRETPEAIELQRLEAEDRAALNRPLSPAPPRSATR